MTPQQFEDYAKNEVKLARQILEHDPENQLQRDRLAYWSVKLGDMDTAREYGTSDKLLGIIAACEKN